MPPKRQTPAQIQQEAERQARESELQRAAYFPMRWALPEPRFTQRMMMGYDPPFTQYAQRYAPVISHLITLMSRVPNMDGVRRLVYNDIVDQHEIYNAYYNRLREIAIEIGQHGLSPLTPLRTISSLATEIIGIRDGIQTHNYAKHRKYGNDNESQIDLIRQWYPADQDEYVDALERQAYTLDSLARAIFDELTSHYDAYVEVQGQIRRYEQVIASHQHDPLYNAELPLLHPDQF